MTMQSADHESLIRQRAYTIWEQEGRPDGCEWDHWERAAHEIMTRPATIEAPTNIEAKLAAPQAKTASAGKSRLRSILKSALMARQPISAT